MRQRSSIPAAQQVQNHRRLQHACEGAEAGERRATQLLGERAHQVLRHKQFAAALEKREKQEVMSKESRMENATKAFQVARQTGPPPDIARGRLE